MITGYTSAIVEKLLSILKADGRELEIIRCGRDDTADIKVDFSSVAQTRVFCDQLFELNPDYFFINHGLLVGKKVNECREDEIAGMLNVNLISVLMIMEVLTKIEDLRTVTMSSISGKAGSYDTLYAATKAGVDVVLKCTVPSLPSSSRLNAISPGIIEDARMTLVRKDLDVLEGKKNATPSKEFTTSSEVASLVSFLMFDSANINGENVNINGGLYVK